MVPYIKFMEGVAKFIDNEITPKITGWQKWIFGAGSGIAMQKADKIFNELKTHPILKTLDIIDGDNVNVEILYNEFIKQADKGPVKIDLPMLGSLTLSRNDLEVLYNYIRN